MQAALARACMFACLLALAGCATLAPRPLPPQVHSVQVRVIVFSFPRVRLGVELDVHNPNASDIDVAALELAISVEGEPVARATLARPATLPARANALLMLDASGHLGAALAGAARGLTRGGGPLRYVVEGSVQLRNGASYPFRRSGVLVHV